jgi:hypothetical protein
VADSVSTRAVSSCRGDKVGRATRSTGQGVLQQCGRVERLAIGAYSLALDPFWTHAPSGGNARRLKRPGGNERPFQKRFNLLAGSFVLIVAQVQAQGESAGSQLFIYCKRNASSSMRAPNISLLQHCLQCVGLRYFQGPLLRAPKPPPHMLVLFLQCAACLCAVFPGPCARFTATLELLLLTANIPDPR